MDPQRKDIFDGLYRTHGWGGISCSGPGSDPEHTVGYIRFFNDWLRRHPACHSIVELGCGDWATTRLLELSPQHCYVGYDIVTDIIDENCRRFQSDTVRFKCSDFLVQPPKDADLLVVKDVLQHLSNTAVHWFLEHILPRFRYAIITNDTRKYIEQKKLGILITRRDLQEPNTDINDGSSRPLRLDAPPFSLPVIEKSSYPVVVRTSWPRLVYVKDILVWCRQPNSAERQP